MGIEYFGIIIRYSLDDCNFFKTEEIIKKISLIVLALIFSFGLIGCNDDETTITTNLTTATTETQTEEPTYSLTRGLNEAGDDLIKYLRPTK